MNCKQLDMDPIQEAMMHRYADFDYRHVYMDNSQVDIDLGQIYMEYRHEDVNNSCVAMAFIY